MWLTDRERLTFALLGGAALLGLGVLLWQQQHPPLRVAEGSPPPSFDKAQDGAPSGVERAPYAQWDAQVQAARQVDVNHADAEELERLPGIGPTTAKRIIDYRTAHGPFRTAEELLNVSGIGPKTLEAMQDDLSIK